MTLQEDLTPESITNILQGLKDGKEVKPGPQSERKFSEPNGPLTALTEEVSHGALCQRRDSVLIEIRLRFKQPPTTDKFCLPEWR